MRKRILVVLVSLAAAGLSGCDTAKGPGTGLGFYSNINLNSPTPAEPTTASSGQGFFANLFAPPPPARPAGPPPNPYCVSVAKQRAVEATYVYLDVYDSVFNRVYNECLAQRVFP